MKIFAFTLFLLILSSFAYGYTYTDCAGAPCYWDSWPVPYYISSAGTKDIDNEVKIVKESFARWEKEHQTLCGIKFSFKGKSKINHGESDNTNVIAWIESGWDYGPKTLAVTQCWHYQNSSKFLDCDILVNGQDFSWGESDSARAFDLKSTLVHEIGHFWGLDHSNLQQATMYAYYDHRYNASDLDYDDILGARDKFCPEEDLPPDDSYEENDSRVTAEFWDDGFELENLRLYDDDWFKIKVKKGKRVKVEVLDDDLYRQKMIYLATRGGEIIEGRPCDGDCAVALLDPDDDSLFNSSSEKDFNILVRGEFDDNPISIDQYHIRVELVDPGKEGDLYDDDDGDGSGGLELCGCDQGGAYNGISGGGKPGAALLVIIIICFWAFRQIRYARR